MLLFTRPYIMSIVLRRFEGFFVGLFQCGGFLAGTPDFYWMDLSFDLPMMINGCYIKIQEYYPIEGQNVKVVWTSLFSLIAILMIPTHSCLFWLSSDVYRQSKD